MDLVASPWVANRPLGLHLRHPRGMIHLQPLPKHPKLHLFPCPMAPSHRIPSSKQVGSFRRLCVELDEWRPRLPTPLGTLFSNINRLLQKNRQNTFCQACVGVAVPNSQNGLLVGKLLNAHPRLLDKVFVTLLMFGNACCTAACNRSVTGYIHSMYKFSVVSANLQVDCVESTEHDFTAGPDETATRVSRQKSTSPGQCRGNNLLVYS